MRRVMTDAGFAIHPQEDLVALEDGDRVTNAVLSSGASVPAENTRHIISVEFESIWPRNRRSNSPNPGAGSLRCIGLSWCLFLPR
ncbi:MAG: hypothetical protein IMW95_01060 [Moorella humiferrea]|nr:hypothetical protein [Moorella humiferrea]